MNIDLVGVNVLFDYFYKEIHIVCQILICRKLFFSKLARRNQALAGNLKLKVNQLS